MGGCAMDESRKEKVLKWIQSEKSGMNVCLYSWIHCITASQIQ